MSIMRPGFTSSPSACKMRLKSSRLCRSAASWGTFSSPLGETFCTVTVVGSVLNLFSSHPTTSYSPWPVDDAVVDGAHGFVPDPLQVILVFQNDPQCFCHNLLVECRAV